MNQLKKMKARKFIMYERFTDRARKVIALANKRANQLYNPEKIVKIDHLLLGLYEEGKGYAARVLKNNNFNINNLLKLNKADYTNIYYINDKLPNSPKVKDIIEISKRLAQDLKHNYISTEHLLLALVNEYDNDEIWSKELRDKIKEDLLKPYKVNNIEKLINILLKQQKEINKTINTLKQELMC